MDLDQTVMVAGIGCRSGVTEAEVEAALTAALRLHAPSGAPLTLIATAAAKAHEAALAAVAKARGIPLALIEQADLEAANTRTVTRSERSMATMNVHSVAEAAALAGADVHDAVAALNAPDISASRDIGRASSEAQRPHSRLLGPRVVVGVVTCALAIHQVEST